MIGVPVALEQTFTMKVGDASIKGVIDRIDGEKTKDGISWHIIDYKTGAPPKDGKLGFDDKEQLFLYQIAAQEVFVKKVVEGGASRSGVPAVEVAASHFRLPFGVSLSVLAQV